MWLTVAGLALTAVLGAVPIYLSTRPDTPEEHVAACRKAHAAPLERDVPAAAGTWRRLYGDCSWPPVPGAAKDGYFEIKVTTYPIPGAVMADKFTSVQVFKSGCAAYRLWYKFENMGTSFVAEPLLLENDEIVSMYDGSPEQVPFPLTRTVGWQSDGRLVVLTHNRYEVHQVTCVAPA